MAKTLASYFLKTAVHQGPGARAMLPDLLASLGGKRAVLFTDQGLVKAGVADMITRLFDLPHKGYGIELAGVFDKIPQDAESTVIDEAAKYFRDVRGDALIALGGGSVQDSVKGIKYLMHKNKEHILDLMPANFLFEAWPNAQLITIPHIGLPTTAGTGAEVSVGGVIYNAKEKVKADFGHPFIGPDVAILDPELTVTLPKHLTAATAFDALTHAIEGVASPASNIFVDAFGFEAVKKIKQNLPKVMENLGDVEARNELLGASAIAILSFVYAIPGAFPVHNFAHAMGAHYRVHHGTANAIFLTPIMEEIPSLYLPKVEGLAKALDLPVQGKSKETLLQDVIADLVTLRRACGLPDDFKPFNVPTSAIFDLTMAVMKDPIGLMYPVPMDVIGNVLGKVVID